jgi:hypothetical protein
MIRKHKNVQWLCSLMVKQGPLNSRITVRVRSQPPSFILNKLPQNTKFSLQK